MARPVNSVSKGGAAARNKSAFAAAIARAATSDGAPPDSLPAELIASVEIVSTVMAEGLRESDHAAARLRAERGPAGGDSTRLQTSSPPQEPTAAAEPAHGRDEPTSGHEEEAQVGESPQVRVQRKRLLAWQWDVFQCQLAKNGRLTTKPYHDYVPRDNSCGGLAERLRAAARGEAKRGT